MSDHVALASRSLALHRGERPLLLPNPWDQGSAVLLAWLGFQALATTSSGFAATLGRLDGAVRLAAEAGLAGCSVEDFTGHPDTPIYEPSLAAARIEAAAEAAHRGPVGLVLTARAENHLHGRADLADTIDRLQAYQQAGADVLYAPGLTRLEGIRQLVASVDRPVNVLARPGVPPVAELADVGVRRVSVGFAFAALGALVEAATELLEDGTYSFWERASVGSQIARPAFATTVPWSQQASGSPAPERAEATGWTSSRPSFKHPSARRPRPSWSRPWPTPVGWGSWRRPGNGRRRPPRRTALGDPDDPIHVAVAAIARLPGPPPRAARDPARHAAAHLNDCAETHRGGATLPRLASLASPTTQARAVREAHRRSPGGTSSSGWLSTSASRRT